MNSRGEHGQAVDMVPVAVGDQDVGRGGSWRQCAGQGKDAAAAIEYQQGVAGRAYFDAGRVTAVAHRVRAGRGDRTAHPLKVNFIAALL